MKILIINGDCIQTNTSANLCHISYIRGIVDAGHQVCLLSADGRDYELDENIVIPDGVTHYTYHGTSIYEKLSLKKKSSNKTANISAAPSQSEPPKNSLISDIVTMAKRTVLSLYGVHGIYATFVRKAKNFSSDIDFDFVLSISTPVTSHLLAMNLIKKGNIRTKHWIQIWEDPWYSDAYGFNGKKKIFREEKRLLYGAEKICYVSPLTLINQKKLFAQSADKMYWCPLPSYYQNVNNSIDYLSLRFGYFGDYSFAARDLLPFYNTAVKENYNGTICGNSDLNLQSTKTVHIYPRLTLKELKPHEDDVNVLVFVCNRKGGQIPGKIYQYTATNKYILFILDGTDDEKKVIKEFFEPLNRYVFCENNEASINDAIKKIQSGTLPESYCSSRNDFEPKKIIENILNGAI